MTEPRRRELVTDPRTLSSLPILTLYPRSRKGTMACASRSRTRGIWPSRRPCRPPTILDNYTTGGWEQPFDPKTHLRPLVPLESSPSIFAGVQSADLADVMLQRSDVAAVIITVDTAGAPIATVDVWTLPCPVPDPARGGWCR